MKILFVEDELSKNIPRIVRLFEKYLGKKRIQRLEAMEADTSGYGATPEEIKALVDDTGIVEAEYRFPEALAKIRQQHEHYALFIVDRNLAESDYDYAEAVAADPSFSEALYNEYFEREGDCLLYKLAFKGVDVRRMFYFMTAYDATSELKNARGLEELLGHLGDFKVRNFIEKSNEEAFQRLKDRINNHQELSRIAEHQHHIRLLRQHLDETAAEGFRKVVLHQDKHDRIGDNLTEIRKIYEKILAGACRHIPEMASACVTTHGAVPLGTETLNWLSNHNHINSIIRNHCFSIKTICSDFGSHDKKEDRKVFPPSPDTVKALIYALRDVIGWFGGVCARSEGRRQT